MLETLVPRIYDAALEPEGWPDLLRDLGEELSVCNFLSQEALSGFGAGDNWSFGFDRGRYDDAPAEIWRPEGSRSIRYLAIAPLARPFDRRVCMPDAEIDLDPIGRHFVGNELFHIVLSTLQRGDGTLSFLMIGRPKDRPSFRADEVERIALLTDHLGRAMRIHGALSRTRARASGFAAAADRLATGVVLADGTLKILHKNGAAERMLETGDGITRRNGAVQLGSTRAQRKLANTVKSHLMAIYGKLGVQSQAQLVRLLMARLLPLANYDGWD